MGIKWTLNQQQRLINAVNKYNDAIEKQLSRKVNPDSLPPQLDYNKIKSDIRNANQLLEVERMARNASKKDAFDLITNEAGTTDYKFNFDEAQRKVNYINKRREKQRETIQPSTYRGTMGTEISNNLKPKEFNAQTITPSNWEKFVQSVERQSRFGYEEEMNERYLYNYISAIKAMAPWRDDLIEIVRQIGGKKLFESTALGAEYTISYLYPGPSENIDEHMDYIYSLWQDVL